MDALDYPAAHSMDTSWFAVDEDGRVARFESSEDGAVPNNAATGGGAADPSFDTFALDAVRIARALVARAAKPDAAEIEPIGPHARTHPERAVIVLRAPSHDPNGGYRDGAQRSSVETRFATDGLLVLHEASPRIIATTKPLSPKELDALATHPDVIEIVSEHETYEWFEAPDLDDGLFHYHHDYGDNGAPGAYAREKAPAAPLRLEDIPVAVREHVGALKLPLHFARTERLQLADHMQDADASIWGDRTLRGEPLGGVERPARSEPVRVPPKGVLGGLALLWLLLMIGAFVFGFCSRHG